MNKAMEVYRSDLHASLSREQLHAIGSIPREVRDGIENMGGLTQIKDAVSATQDRRLVKDIALWQGLEASEASRLTQQLNESLEAIAQQAELAAFRPRYKELAEMAANAEPAWREMLTNSAANYAFATLATLHEALERSPFTEETFAALRSQLGDWRDIGLSAELFDQQKRQETYLRAGLDPRLIDLKPQTFEAMLEATQLRPATLPPLLRPYVSADLEALEASDVEEPDQTIKVKEIREEGAASPGPTRSTTGNVDQAGKAEEAKELDQPVKIKVDENLQQTKDYQHLYRFESQFRGFVSEVLAAAAGPQWITQRVPADCLKTWRDRQDKDRKARHHQHSLLSYSDLGDWSKIIQRADNWPLFQPHFRRKAFVEESFTRLIPLRNDLAHMRPLTKADRLVFYAEIQQLSMAICKPQAPGDDEFEAEALFQ